jgi:hypothetical protein
MGKGAAGKQAVVDYTLSIHFRVATGPVDELLAIYVGEKEAWSGSVTTESDIQISRPDLFGGIKKEGGTVGTVRYLPGGPDQVMPAHLASRLGLTTATCPGYRGMASLFFTGNQASFNDVGGIPGALINSLYYQPPGFLWSSNNPYLKTVWARVRRRSRGLNPATAFIAQQGITVKTAGNEVTVNGVTATVPQGTTITVNGAAILLQGKSLTVNGTQIITDLDNFTVSVNGLSASMGDGVTTIGDYTISTPASHMDGNQRIADVVVIKSEGTLDSNPVHVIYEAMINTDWGQGGAPSTIDTANWNAAALTVFNERLGVSLLWSKQTDIESFCQELQDHIQATVFVHPRTGLMTIKLIRGDYRIEDLPILNADNCKILSFDRKGLGETINEIVATYTNPENEKEETVTAQNNANISLQGGIISDSRNYYAFRTVELAQWAAFRDLRTASAPLASFEIEADRSAWDFVPGGCARLQMPEYGFDDVVLRLGKIDYGKPGQPAIKLSTIEDIFAEESADYEAADQSQFVDPAADPAAPAFARLITAPAFLVTQALRSADTQMLDYPEVLAATLVSQTNDDTYSFGVYGIDTLPNGETVADLIATRPTLGHVLLPTALPAEATTAAFDFGPPIGGTGPRPGGLVFIGNIGERGQELALLQSVGDTGWTLKRGILDTVPRAWPTGTTVWFVNGDSNIVLENVIYAAGETVATRIATSTSRGTTSFEDAAPLAAVMTGRPHLPNRPANVTVAGTQFGTVDLSASLPATVPVTWSTRNRTLEDSQILSWTDGPVTPEPGQTTTIRVLSASGSVLALHAGLTGNSFDVPSASFGSQAVADIAVYASRDGLESLQSHRVRVKIRDGGWGDNWGLDWGGADIPAGTPNPDPVPEDPEPDPEDFPNLPPWKRQQYQIE